jgi:hypothetical protein
MKRKQYKNHFIVPLTTFFVVLIYIGYTLLFISGSEPDLFSIIKTVSIEIFVICILAMMLIIILNKRLVDNYLTKHPEINNFSAVEELKPIARSGMYSALIAIALLCICSLTAIITIFNHESVLFKGIVGVLFSIAVAIMNWYNESELELQQIECSDDYFEVEFSKIIKCWQTKTLPNF